METSAPIPRAHRRSVALELTPRLVLGLLVGVSVVARFALVLGRQVQGYLPDEYLYGEIARSIAEGRGPRVLGVPGSTPALLQPLLTAPTWLAGDPELAFRLTQGINCVAMALGGVVVYAIARALAVDAWTAVAAAAVALASPDLLYTGYVTADAIAYPIALLAILAAIHALDRPSFRTQALFLAAAGLATFARVQYAGLFVAAGLAAIVVERGRLGVVVRRHTLVIAAPAVGLAAAVAVGALGRYEQVGSFGVSSGTIRWIPTSAALLAVSCGVIVVPGALAWTGSQLLCPTGRARTAFAAVGSLLIGALIVASALVSTDTGSERFFERYLMLGLPLATIAFCCWMAESRPARPVALGVAAIIVVVLARIPVSEYVVGQGRFDSPLLLATNWLQGPLGIGGASLLLALAATGCAVISVAAAFGRVGARGALVVSAVALAAISVGAHAADHADSATVVRTKLGGNPAWVDATGARGVLLVEPRSDFPAAAMLLALRNRSVTEIGLFGPRATPFDGASKRLRVGERGDLRLDGAAVARPLLLDGASTRFAFQGTATVERADDFTLVTPTGPARLAATLEGLYADGWLSGKGTLTVFATESAGTCTVATLTLSLPRDRRAPVTLRLAGDGRTRVVTIAPGETRSIPLHGSATHRTVTTITGTPVSYVYVGGLRAVSARAQLTTAAAPCPPRSG